jgi:4-hydroxy-2-oxoheptanedioate aldolase
MHRKNIQLIKSLYSLPSAAVAKTILRRSPEYSEGGFSWVLIDAEHGLINDSHYYEVYTTLIHYL